MSEPTPTPPEIPVVIVSTTGKTKEQITAELTDLCREAGILTDEPPAQRNITLHNGSR